MVLHFLVLLTPEAVFMKLSTLIGPKNEFSDSIRIQLSCYHYTVVLRTFCICYFPDKGARGRREFSSNYYKPFPVQDIVLYTYFGFYEIILM